ncbi:MAG: CatB-related O-acetyltransferase [Chlorobi bacterium]|nr:CatB-related O-acetyltransferase [Chlorobiota bacterium]
MQLLQFFWKVYLRITNPTCSIRAASLSRNVKFEKGVVVESGTHLQASLIGRHTYINKYCLIDKNTKSIGRFCSIAYNVKIGLGSHPSDWVGSHPFAYDVKYGFVKEGRKFDGSNTETIIGNDVWIGANATILAGVKVGDGAIVGANSLVTKDVEPYSIVVGTPAKHRRYRFEPEIISGLQKLQWWDWDDKKIKENVGLFDDPVALLKRFKA